MRRISQFKLKFTSIFTSRNALVRRLVQARQGLLAASARVSEEPRHIKNGADNLSIADLYAVAAEVRLNIINRILLPLLKYEEPLNFTLNPDSIESLNWDQIQEKLAESQEDAMVFIRKYFKYCLKREKFRHPEWGNLSAREWLCLLPEIEKNITREILRKRLKF